MKTVTFVVSTAIQADTAVVWAQALAERAFATELVAPSGVLASVDHSGFKRVTRIDVASLRRSTYLSQLASIATSPEFSPSYNRGRRASRAGAARLLCARAFGGQRDTATSINRLLDRFRLRTASARRVTIALSISNYPGYLDRSPVLTLTESWDHPRSRPACYVSESVAAWNQDIADDWQHYQGASSVVVGYPTKLRYAIEGPVREFERKPGAPILYAATSSSNTSQGWLFGEELRLIAALADASAWAGLKLQVKPKPNGRPGEFDDVVQRFPNVTIGRYGDARAAADYRLNDEYNRYRLAELDSVDVVMNVGSTFALDAAAAGIPVFQLDLRSRHDLPELAAAQEAYHIFRYLLDAPSVTRVPRGESLQSALRSVMANGLNMSADFGSDLRTWVRPTDQFETAVDRVAREVDALLG